MKNAVGKGSSTSMTMDLYFPKQISEERAKRLIEKKKSKKKRIAHARKEERTQG